jgi:two-component system response regulator RegX3
MERQPVVANESATTALAPDQDVYDDGFFRIEHNSYYVTWNGTSIPLPRKEFLILSRLSRNVGRIVPMHVLWDYVWDGEPFNPVTLRVYVSHLRRKLMPFDVKIKTLISVGYYLYLPQTDSAKNPAARE